ncbi:unnamed protein product [Rhizoctonia solani]|uniref:PH domain-containing protein n=1 Tax=Rhizoctonia solani TaxID=456999 RepID=A0A8H3E3P3_9AGAM|nr:unnamed protein product [Rhizoctonia solani]
MARNSRSYSRSPDSRIYGTATFSSRSPSYDGRSASPNRSETARSYTSYTRSNHSDTYYDDEGTVQDGDSTTEVERDIQLDDDDEEYYSETERTRSPARSFVSESQTYGTTRSPSRTQTYDSRAPSRTQTYDSRSPSRTDTQRSPSRTDTQRSPSRTETYTDAQSRAPSRTHTYGSRSASRTPTTSRSPSRAYSAYSNDDDQTFDDAQTYEDEDEGASAYDDGRSGSAFYDDGRSGTGSGTGTRYDDSRSASRFTDERTASRSASRSASRFDDDASAHSGYDDAQSGYDDARSGAYDDAQGSDYHSESQVSDGQNYAASQGGRSQSAHSQSALSQSARSQGARSEGQQSEGQYSEDYATSASSSINPQEILASLHSMTLDPVTFERKVLSTVEEQTERTSSSLSRLSANRFASGGHGGASGSEMSLSPSRPSAHSRASSEAASLFSPSTHGSYLSGGPSHTPIKLFSPTAPISALGKEKDRATSLERPTTAQSDYRSTAGSDHSSFLRPSASEQNLKLKDKEEVLLRHPSATLGRRTGDLIAFFESGRASDAAKSVGSASPVKSVASMSPVKSVASMSPGKVSVGLPARTYASGSGSGSGGSYTGSGSDIGGGSSVASPFSRPRGVGVGLGFDALFTPSFPSRSGSPFRPASPTKSAASGTGSFVSGSHRSGASHVFGGSEAGQSETARSGASQTYRSETGRSGASESHRSETARSGVSESYRSETARSGVSESYRSETARTGAGETYRSQTPTYRSETPTYRSESPAYRSETPRSAAHTYRSGAGSDTYRSGGGSQTYRSDGGSETYRSGAGSQTYRSEGGSQTYRSEEGSQTYRSEGGSQTYRSDGGSQTYQSDGASEVESEAYQSEGAGSQTYRSEGAGSQTYRSDGGSQTYRSGAGSETYRSDGGSEAGLSVPGSETYRSETARSAGSETARSQTYRSDGGSDTYRTETYRAPSEAPTARSATETYRSQSRSQSRPRSAISGTYTAGSETYRSEGSYHSGSETYRTHGSDTYRESESRAETPRPDTYTDTESETYRAGSGSEGGASRFMSQLYPRESDVETVTGRSPSSHGQSESGFSQGHSEGTYSQGRSEGAFSQSRSEGTYSQGHSEGSYGQGRSEGSYGQSRTEGSRSPTRSDAYSQGRSEGAYSQGRSEGGHTQGSATYSQGSSTYIRGTSTYQDSRAYTPTYTQDTSTYVPGTEDYTEGSEAYVQEESDTYTQGSRTPPPIPPKSPRTPRGARTATDPKEEMTPVTPKTPNPSAEDKFADWQDRTPQGGDKTAGTPYTAVVPLTPKTAAGAMTPKSQTGAMTPRTSGGRYGKALSEASTAPTSAEGLMRHRISREVVTSVPVPSESEAITLGHQGHGQKPLRISALWYLNVHAPPPFEWLRTQAVLYPSVLILTWIAPTGGRGVVTLDLVNCTEVRSAPSPSHPSARDDVGSVAARLQSADLAETLCPFQLLYTDGVERLGTDTARERVRWVGAIWDVLATIARGPPRALTDGSESESGTLQRSSSVRSHSSEGSATTSFVAPAVDIADTASVVSYVPHETADDTSVASFVPPSRAPSLRRTASMADLELEADIDRALGRTPAPASVSSEDDSNLLSVPRSRSRISGSDGSGYRTPTTDRARSSRYSASNVTGTGREDTTYVPTDTEQSTVRGVRIVADSISFRGSSSARGDTHDALSTGYGSTGRSEGVVSSATYSRRRTLSGVSSSGSGLSRSHGLRRPKRDRTSSTSITFTMSDTTILSLAVVLYPGVTTLDYQ